MQLKHHFVLMAFFCAIPISSAEILIVHGRLLPETDTRRYEQVYPITRTYIRYEIIAIGKGMLNPNISSIYRDDNKIVSSNTIPISFFQRTAEESLPLDAILILNNGFWEQFTPQHSYRVLGEEAWRGILPYTLETWNTLLAKPNNEFIDVALSDRMPPAETYAFVEKLLLTKGANEQDIYFKMLRRIPFQWVVSACFLKDDELFDYVATLNDRGDLLNEIGPEPNKYYHPSESIVSYFAREEPTIVPYRRYDAPSTYGTFPGLPRADQ